MSVEDFAYICDRWSESWDCLYGPCLLKSLNFSTSSTFSLEDKLFYVSNPSVGKFPMQLISLEHTADNTVEFILCRQFSSVGLDANAKDILGSAKVLFSWDSEVN